MVGQETLPRKSRRLKKRRIVSLVAKRTNQPPKPLKTSKAKKLIGSKKKARCVQETGAPQVAVGVTGGHVVGKSIRRCSSRGSPWWGTRLLALRCWLNSHST